MRLTLIQSDIIWGKPEENLRRAEALAAQAAAAGADFIVFPECFSTGFLAPELGSPLEIGQQAATFLEQTARILGVATAGSFPFVAEGNPLPFNMLHVYGPYGRLTEYAKKYLFTFAGEETRFRPGREAVTVLVSGIRVCPLICYDLRFPTYIADQAQNTDLFLFVANWPAERQAHWEILLQARAIENQAFVAGVNRVGAGGKLNFTGGSLIVSPTGEIIARGGAKEQLVSADIDVASVERWRKEFPALRDRKA